MKLNNYAKRVIKDNIKLGITITSILVGSAVGITAILIAVIQTFAPSDDSNLLLTFAKYLGYAIIIDIVVLKPLHRLYKFLSDNIEK